MNLLEGKLEAKGLKFAIVVSRFNQHITAKLLEGAKQTLLKAQVADEDITVVFAPGAFEIPLVIKKLAETKQFDAMVAIGCVMRGGTPHFDYVCREASSGIQRVSLETGIPIGFGILMADTADQAMERSGGRMGNRGEEATRAAVEMASLLASLDFYGNSKRGA